MRQQSSAVPEPAAPAPPEHLSPRSRELWAALVPEHAKSLGRRVLLLQALEALDRADEARRTVAEQGMTAVTEATGAIHVHPLLKIETDARRQFTVIWSQLGLTWDKDADCHPWPGGGA